MEVKNQKPKGRTIFEYWWEGRAPETAGGIFLYTDGRVYHMDSVFKGEATVRQYTLIEKHQFLADEIRKFLEQSWDEIKKFPSEASEDVCDGKIQHYKFLKIHCDGYMLDDAAKDIPEFFGKVAKIFRRLGVVSNEVWDASAVRAFADKYIAFMDKAMKDSTLRMYYKFIEGKFPEECRDVGFRMDCGQSVSEKYGQEMERKIFCSKATEGMFDVLDDARILGNAIFSKWRYYNHWDMGASDCKNLEWFKLAFMRLKTILRQTQGRL